MLGAEIDLRSILALLRRQFWLIATTFLVVVVLAGLVAFSLTPRYTASALVMVDPSNKNLLEPALQNFSGNAENARIDSEVEIMGSDTILMRVVQSQNLLAAENAHPTPSLPRRVLQFLRLVQPEELSADDLIAKALRNLRSALSIQRRGLTYLIAVRAQSEDPARAATLANAVTDAYIEEQVQSKIDSALRSRDVLQARIEQARDDISASEGKFDSFISDNIDRLADQPGTSNLASLQSQIAELTAARESNSQRADQLVADAQQGNWQSVVSNVQSQALSELDRQREELASSLAGADGGSPVAVDLRAELAKVEDQMRAQALTAATSLRDEVSTADDQATSLRQQVRQSVLSSDLPTDVLTQLFELQQNAELARSQYQTLLQRTQELDALASLQVADSRVVSPALAPQTPSFPNRTLILAAAGLVGLGLGLGLAFLYEYLIGGFTSEEQLLGVARAGANVTVPRQTSRNTEGEIADLVVTSQLSVFAESVRRLRATLDHALRGVAVAPGKGKGKVIVVTSTAPGEGKSTMALSLARTYALAGRSTLVIDCDMRRPSLHRLIGCEPSQGLMEHLTSPENNSLSAIVTEDPLARTTVIVGARQSRIPTDQMLASTAFDNLLLAARKSFDIIIIDTPPVGAVVDALYVAPNADAIAFVIQWASTPQTDVKKALAAISAVRRPETEIVTVLNQQAQSRAARYRKYGQYYAETT